jgi:predicted DNA-binding protein (UPF0251 family)
MPLGRPKKTRIIGELPQVKQFSPRGKAGRPDYIELTAEEWEAVRLADYLGYHQKLSSQAMGISQQTFSRILKKARKGVAEALVNGKIIRIKEEGTPGQISRQNPLKNLAKAT